MVCGDHDFCELDFICICNYANKDERVELVFDKNIIIRVVLAPKEVVPLLSIENYQKF